MLGAGILGVAILFLGRLGWLHPWLFRVAFAVIAVASLATSRFWRAGLHRLDPSSVLWGVVIAPFVVGNTHPRSIFDSKDSLVPQILATWAAKSQ